MKPHQVINLQNRSIAEVKRCEGTFPYTLRKVIEKKNCIILIKVKKQIIDRENKDASSTIAWSHTGLRFRPVVVLSPFYKIPTKHSPEPRVMVVLSFHKNTIQVEQSLVSRPLVVLSFYK